MKRSKINRFFTNIYTKYLRTIGLKKNLLPSSIVGFIFTLVVVYVSEKLSFLLNWYLYNLYFCIVNSDGFEQ